MDVMLDLDLTESILMSSSRLRGITVGRCVGPA